ncbi:MAG: tripartite tricarboxylate transporter permease [Clostridiaceae bacterium]
MSELLIGFSNVLLNPINLVILIVGTLLGFLGGSIPGISGTMMVVLLVPLTYSLKPDSAILSMVVVYCAAVFGGSISAILFRTPGAPESVATVLDGYPMTKQGKSAEALGLSVYGSAIGGIIGTLFLIFLTPQLAKVALAFGPPEYFGLTVLAMSVIASLGDDNQLKALISALIGLFLMTVGIDPMTGINRFTFGSQLMMSGFNFIPILIGLFAVSEILRRFERDTTKATGGDQAGNAKNANTSLPSFSTMRKLIPTTIRGSVIGTIIGILPGIGATTAAMVAYSEEQRASKHKELFGTGLPEGVLAPETAHNAAASGAIIPLLALGIPGSATTAIMLGAFILHGIQPGPLIFKEQGPLVYTIFAGAMMANILILFIAKPFIKGFTQIIKVPFNILGPIIIVLCMVGSFAIRNNMLDVWITLIFGVIGYIFEKFDYPTSPIVIGSVLGALAENEFRRSMVMSSGSWGIFFSSPIAAGLIIFGVLSFIIPLARNIKKKYDKGNINKLTTEKVS